MYDESNVVYISRNDYEGLTDDERGQYLSGKHIVIEEDYDV